MLIYIIIGAVILVALFAIMFIQTYNKYQFSIIKLTEAENIIKQALKDRLALFDRIIPVLKERIKDEDDNKLLDSIIKIKNKKLNSIELNKEIETCDKRLIEILDSNVDLYKDEAIENILKEFYKNKEDIQYGENYYNDEVVHYNKLVRSFPSNIVGLFIGCRKKDFYQENI